MADIFTFVKGGKKKVYNIAGGTEEEAIKYVRYLHRNALFGTHTGLPQKIRNSKMNESLVSNIGDYSVLDVYAYPQTKCIIGTVVNFHISNDVNPLGETYVYPCTDKNKPMGYMISDATPDTMGVCLVHGVLEVPLYYFSGSTEEKKDFVEYDIENACFKFSDSGYPVFNVYQDVDGDWIAIILFGDVSSDYEYDGPFAVSVTGVTGSTTFVDVLGGDVFFNDARDVCDDLTVPIGISTGESLWLSTMIVGSTHSYDFIAQSTAPIDGSTVFYTKIAENNDGDIRQIHYGDIRYSRTKIIAGSNNVHISPINGLGDVTISVDESLGTIQDLTLTGSTVGGSTASIGITGSTSQVKIIPENDLYVKTGTGINELIIGSTTAAYTNVVTSVSGGTDASIIFSNLNGTAKTLHLKASSNIQLSADGNTGIIISATGGSVTPYVQDLTHSFNSGSATLGLTGSAISVTFTTAGNTYIDNGNDGEIIIGSTSGNLSCASTGIAGIYSLYISDSSDSKVYLKEGDGTSISLSGNTFTISGNTGTVTGITSSITSTSATISSIGGTGSFKITKGDNITITSGESNEIIISSTVTGNTGTVTGITSSVGVGDATISTIGGNGFVNLSAGTNTYIEAGDNGEIIIGSTFTETLQDLNAYVGDGTASIGLTGSTSMVSFVNGDNIFIEENDNGEIIIGTTISEYEYDGAFAIKVDHVDSQTPTTLYIYRNGGVISFENGQKTISALSAEHATALASGESYWLRYDVSSNTTGIYKSAAPIYTTSTQINVELARNENGVLKQIQFGNVEISKAKLTSLISGGTAFIGVVGSTNTIKIIGTNGVVLSNSSGNISLSVNGWGTFVTGITSSITGNTATVSTIGGTGNVVFYGVGGTTISSGENGEIIVGSTFTETPQNLSSFVSGNTAFIGLSDSLSSIKIVGGTNVDITGTTDGEIIIGSTVSGGTGSSFDYTGSFKVDCWDTEDDGIVHNVRIYDSNNRDDMVGYAGWVHIGNQKYHVPEYNDTFSDGDVIYLVGTFNDSNALAQLTFTKIQTFFPSINDNQFCVRICYATNGKMYQTQYGDIVQPARLVGDGETVEIHSNVISAIGGGGGGTVQGLYSAIKGGTPAICITGSTTYVPIAGGTNTYTERDSSGAIIVGSTASGGGGSGYVVNHYYHTQYSYLTNSGGTGILQAIANCSYDILLKSNSDTFTVEQLKVRYSSTAPSSQVASIDDEGCLLIELPTGVTEECYIDFHFAYPVTTVFASPDGKNIVDVYGANTNMTQPYADNNTVRMIYVKTDSDYVDGCWYFTII